MGGKGRIQGGMSGGARKGTGPKKQPGAPPTRKEKREARALREAAAASFDAALAQRQPVRLCFTAYRACHSVRSVCSLLLVCLADCR